MRISDWSSDVCSSDLAGAISIDLQTGASNGGDAEGDRFDGVERFIGTGFADALVGDGGDQILVGGAGGDRIDGAGGFDTAVYSGSAAGVKINLATGAVSGGEDRKSTRLNSSH